MDCISGHNLGWQREPSYITAAGLSATAELRAELLARDTVASGTQVETGCIGDVDATQHDMPLTDTLGVRLQECRRAWVHACPVTGQFWKRAHHNAYPL